MSGYIQIIMPESVWCNPRFYSRYMEDRSLNIEPIWWRHSRYEILELEHDPNISSELKAAFKFIVPAQGATLETFKPSFENPGSAAITLGNMDRDHPSISIAALQAINTADEDQLLAWASIYGLWGILPLTAISIRLASRWLPMSWLGKANLLFPTQTHHFRTNMGWKSISHSTMKGEDPRSGRSSKIIELDEADTYEDWHGRLVDADDTTHPTPGIITTKLFGDEFSFKGLPEIMGNFFPGVAKESLTTYEFPLPLSREFWSQYGESIWDYKNVFRSLKEILEGLAQLGPVKQIPQLVVDNVLYARRKLHSVLHTSPALDISENGSFGPKFGFYSLVSMFAFAVWQELSSSSILRHCKRTNCRKLFFTTTTRREYCTDRCRMAEEKARQRKGRASKSKPSMLGSHTKRGMSR
jgi:hypothetical protein